MGVRLRCVSSIASCIGGVDVNGLLEVKGHTKLECIRKCRKREDIYEYVTPIHKVEILNKKFTYNKKKHKNDKFDGFDQRTFYRAYMRLKKR